MRGNNRLTGPWRRIHGAIWMIGLVIIFWKGWWWPGILILVAVSAMAEAVIQLAVPSATTQEDQTKEPTTRSNAPSTPAPAPPSPTQAPQQRADLLPAKCAACGGPVSGDDVKWTGQRSASCPYCGANLPMQG